MTVAGRARALLAVAGVAVLGYGLLGMLRHADATAPLMTAIWLGSLILAHDLVLAPVVAVIGWVLTRLLPDWIRPIVQAGLVVAAVVVLSSLPVVLRQGAPSNYDSLLPLDYRTNLGRVLIAVALGTAALVAARAWRRSRSGDAPSAAADR